MLVVAGREQRGTLLRRLIRRLPNGGELLQSRWHGSDDLNPGIEPARQPQDEGQPEDGQGHRVGGRAAAPRGDPQRQGEPESGVEKGTAQPQAETRQHARIEPKGDSPGEEPQGGGV